MQALVLLITTHTSHDPLVTAWHLLFYSSTAAARSLQRTANEDINCLSTLYHRNTTLLGSSQVILNAKNTQKFSSGGKLKPIRQTNSHKCLAACNLPPGSAKTANVTPIHIPATRKLESTTWQPTSTSEAAVFHPTVPSQTQACRQDQPSTSSSCAASKRSLRSQS